MVAFRFDNTFEGLLSAVFDAYTHKMFPETLLGPDDVPPLTAEAVHSVTTSGAKADRVYTGLDKRISRVGKNSILMAYLSEEKDAATLLFRYMRKIFDAPLGVTLEGDFSDPDIMAVDQTARKVYCDYHLLLGFARFQKTAEGIYFSALSPKYNVLSLMLPHFRDRFADQRWIIYDAKRNFGFFHENGEIMDMTLDGALLTNGMLPADLLAQGEAEFQALWRQYFVSAAIKERANPKLQARCLPRRYWPYMTEMRPAPR